jgi:hypothetical protein
MSTAPIIRTACRAVNAEIASHLKNQISLEDYIEGAFASRDDFDILGV